MTATARAYVPRYYSEVARKAGSPNDCAICAGLETYDAATLGEGVTRDDGGLMDTVRLRELRDEAGLPDEGGLRLDQVAKYLRFVSARAGIDPPFELEYYPGHGGPLRLTWDQFKDRIRNGHIGILLGNPSAVKNATSPLRDVQASDDYDHAIAVMDGRTADARVFNALRRKQDGYNGERISWVDLKQFTESEKRDPKTGKMDRQFGSPDAIGCAVALIGDETEAARLGRATAKVIGTLRDAVKDARAEVTAASSIIQRTAAERDQAKRDAAANLEAVRATSLERDKALDDWQKAAARVAELEALPAADCADAVTTERNRVLDAIAAGVDQVTAGLR